MTGQAERGEDGVMHKRGKPLGDKGTHATVSDQKEQAAKRDKQFMKVQVKVLPGTLPLMVLLVGHFRPRSADFVNLT